MADKIQQLIKGLKSGNFKAIARVLSLIENESDGSEVILKGIEIKQTPVIGITGPPGAGKSTLLNAIINQLAQNFKIAVLAVDPTSPFNLGSLLGDRIRMTDQFNNGNVFIRSIATRGSLGGLSVKTIEMCDVLKAADFAYIFVETVGVGQSEIEIAGLADLTIVVLVPEAGDDIQSIKSGLMEVADVFVVNKADREGADAFSNHLKMMTHGGKNVPILKAIASQSTGVEEIISEISKSSKIKNEKRAYLLTEKAWQLIQNHRMKDLKKEKLRLEITEALKQPFNLYQFIEQFKNS
ncbi:MAG: methylmalonyl Co-A mutase-associated GTPase MeaB [Bacteroidetes bacterium]|nr:methylmalonyl Co-A mutase-associated GTPase MeaB [Bacteroidota bacterium]MBU1371859.1 methylmalonyl Co-A mutase-associated GTPase MeaB [Bacteroidota bacterium]MBU1483256.1 methylmalonyl Co-A mutase-associated GTPase MeaB [Bacteroidota bacterium]MBU1759686.1 methylmalonyl Co-A mutase-associated GTPase MeaB [Bacteroidota bacterium]MBU2046940.1 methylmalonyl Co-A mutase-associated GTPase MeaB [Bacteroidota bacterium]